MEILLATAWLVGSGLATLVGAALVVGAISYRIEAHLDATRPFPELDEDERDAFKLACKGMFVFGVLLAVAGVVSVQYAPDPFALLWAALTA